MPFDSQSPVMTTRPVHSGSLAVSQVKVSEAVPAPSSATITAGWKLPTVELSRTEPFPGVVAFCSAVAVMVVTLPLPSIRVGDAVSSRKGASGWQALTTNEAKRAGRRSIR